MRNIKKRPYSEDEMRAVRFLNDRGLGGGDDPIGFLLAGYESLAFLLNKVRSVINQED